ncbi:MAG: YwaF family protein [Clostridia bacterium]|nr:YwaF family protein [Clostridia bacterium]
MFPTIVFVLSAAIVTALYLTLKKNKPDTFIKVLKVLAVIYPIIGILRFLLSDSFVELVFNMADGYESYIRWAYYIGYAVLPCSVFFDLRLYRNIASFFSLPVAIVYTVTFEHSMSHFLAEGGGGIMLPVPLRYIYHIIELTLALVIPVLMIMATDHRMKLDSAKEPLTALLSIPFIMLIMMPSYIPQSTVGFTSIPSGSFSVLHFSWIALLILAIVAVYFFYKKRSLEDKYALLVFLTIAQLFHTNSIFLRGFTLSRMPLQLCSIAAFFYFVAIIFKKQKIFDFCYLVNIVGGAVAIVLADFGSDAFSFWNLHYIYEHTFVMMVPILGLSLGVFPRVDKKSLKHALIIFAIYFVSSFILGSVINAVSPEEGYPVNFFYMFDLERALDYVPFVGFTGAIHILWGEFEMYPLLVGTIYVIFNLLIIGFYYMTRGIYRIRDRKCAKVEKLN